MPRQRSFLPLPKYPYMGCVPREDALQETTPGGENARMTIADLVGDIRLELTDEQKTRWTDDQMLRVLGKAYRRLGHTLYRNDVEAGRSLYRFDTEAGREDYPLPADFMAESGLYRQDTHTRLEKQSDDSWEQLVNPAETTAWLIRGDSLFLAAQPAGAYPMLLVYWPLVETDSLTLESSTPFGGKFDDMVAEYAALRFKNIDEMDTSADLQLLSDMENNLLNTYTSIAPTTVTRRGWLA